MDMSDQLKALASVPDKLNTSLAKLQDSWMALSRTAAGESKKTVTVYSSSVTKINNIILKNIPGTAFTKMTASASKETKKTAGIFSKAASSIKNTLMKELPGKAFSTLTGALKQTAVDGFKYASELSDAQSMVDTVFGESAGQFGEWSKTALKSFGLSELKAKQFGGTLGAMLKNSGLAGKDIAAVSESLTGLTGDFSSFFGISQDDAFAKVRAGISGDTSALKQFGISMDTASLQAFAMSQGITASYDKMDQASQTLLRYNYIMGASKNVQGDFANGQDSFSKQSAILKTNLQQLAGKIMSGVLPALTGIMQKIIDFVGGTDIDKIVSLVSTGITNVSNTVIRYLPYIENLIKAVIPVINEVIDVIAKFANFIITHWPIIAPILAGIAASILTFVTKTMLIPKVIGVFSKLKLSLLGMGTFFASPFGIAVVAIGVLVAAAILLYKNWSRISMFIVGIWKDYVIPFFNAIGNWFSGVWGGLAESFKGAWNGIVQWFTGIWNGMVAIAKDFANTVIGFINDMISGVNTVTGLIGKAIGMNLQIPMIPKFAEGGFANRPSIFGEAGPEAAIPLKYKNPRSLSLLNQTAKAIGAEKAGAPSITVNLTVNAPGGDPQSIAEAAEDAVVGVIERYFEGRARVAYG